MATQPQELEKRAAQAASRGAASKDKVGPATPRGHRNSAADWQYPFPQPGKPKRKSLPARTESRWPFVDMMAIDDTVIPPQHVKSQVSVEAFKAKVREFADDVGVISIDNPAIAHERDEILHIYPHAQSLVILIGAANKVAMQSRYLPTANHEFSMTEERIFDMGQKTVAYIDSLGGGGLTTAIGWPMEVSQRWSDKIWPLSHRLVAQAAGLGALGVSRNFLHKEFGAYCLMDTVITNLEFNEDELDTPIEWNPCVGCSYCVAACPSGAIKSDGDFDFFTCFNHTYRDSIPAFMDLVHDLSACRPKRFRKRWTDAEIAALWQSMTFHVEYRCFNCVGACTAHMHEEFKGSKEVRQKERDQRMIPLKRMRGEVEERFVIDTQSAREKYGIPPGEWRTSPDPSKPGQGGVRLVELSRIRVSNVDAMMRMMPHVFRGSEADGLDFTVQFDLSGKGGGTWVMRVVDNRCQVHPGETESADLTVRCTGELFLKIHREEVNPVLAIITGKLKLQGDRKIFLTFPRILASTPGHSFLHKLAWRFSRKTKKQKNASKD